MKEKIAWITDSTSGLNPKEGEKLGIHVLPLSVIFGDKVYKEGIDITNAQFYEKLNQSTALPTSSQPTIGEGIHFFEQLKEQYDIGIAVHVSSELSGTYQNSIVAAKMAGFPLVAIDSRTGADATVSMIKEGKRLATEGKSISEIEEFLNEMARSAKGYILVGSLEQLAKGGRVSNSRALIGNILKINLIIKLENGKLVEAKKVRTVKKAKKRVLNYLFDSFYEKQKIDHLTIVSTTTLDEAKEWAQLIEQKCHGLSVNVAGLSPVIGVHGGAGTIGLFWFEMTR